MISNIDQRILFWDASESAFQDITKESNEHTDGANTLSFDSGDYLYVGTYLPFNHRYMELTIPNAITATPVIETWNGSEWKQVADVLDYTEFNGSSFGKSGILQFTPSWDDEWTSVDRTTQVPTLPEFQNGPDIFYKYWLRISFSAPNVSFGLKYVGNLFCSESDLLAEYGHLKSSVLLNAWESGKTDWLDQRVIASEFIVTELKRRGIIADRNNVLDISLLMEACVHRSASIIYNGLGPKNYSEEIAEAIKRYGKALDLTRFETDANANAKKEPFEYQVTTNRATR